jgi:hypothetical protein
LLRSLPAMQKSKQRPSVRGAYQVLLPEAKQVGRIAEGEVGFDGWDNCEDRVESNHTMGKNWG